MRATDRYLDSNPLYMDSSLQFEKVGMDARLSDNVDTWVQEVIQELLKQHPYLGQFEIVPVMTQMEGDKGYGFGYFTVKSRTEAASSPGGDAMSRQAGVVRIRIPIIIRENTLSSFDVFIEEGGRKKAYPLTETRVRQVMFRPQLFDSPGTAPDAASLSDHLYPPGRTSSNIAGNMGASTKLGSAKPYLMEAIGSTINKTDIEKVSKNLEADTEVALALKENEITFPFMRYLANLDPLEGEDIAKVAAESITPNVLMMTREGDGYHLKMANSERYSPEEVVSERASMEELAGKDMVAEVDSTGVSVVSTDPVVRDLAEDEHVEVIERFGEYRVKSMSGKELMGWVFPTVLDFDGTQLPMTLFSNGAAAAMQTEIAGSLVGTGANIIRGRAQGNGFFYRVTSNGTALAFVPGQVVHPFSDPTGEGVVFESVLGERCRVRLAAGLKSITRIGDGEFAIPGDVQWLPFDDSALVELIDKPETFAKVASAKKESEAVRIISDGETWSFDGGCGLDKIAQDDRTALSGPDALFLSCVLGMDERTSMRALGVAGQRGQIKVGGCRKIQTVGELFREAGEKSRSLWEQLPERKFLFKEAASLGDSASVDKVLSIGFLNPENVATFIQYLPDIDATVCKLAEILIAVRIGLKDVPEGAVKGAMERLDEVVTALRALMYRTDKRKS